MACKAPDLSSGSFSAQDPTGANPVASHGPLRPLQPPLPLISQLSQGAEAHVPGGGRLPGQGPQPCPPVPAAASARPGGRRLCPGVHVGRHLSALPSGGGGSPRQCSGWGTIARGCKCLGREPGSLRGSHPQPSCFAEVSPFTEFVVSLVEVLVSLVGVVVSLVACCTIAVCFSNDAIMLSFEKVYV